MSLKNKRTIQLQPPILNSKEKKLVSDCIDKNWVASSGKYINLFEKEIIKFTRSKYAISCINGTSALQISLRLSNVIPGDEVIVPTLTFIAPVNAIKYNGADPIFMDVDEYHNLDVEKTIEFINKHTFFKKKNTINKKTKKIIKALIVVHMWGNPARINRLIEICKKRNIHIIEDASESLGSYYKNKTRNIHTGTLGRFGCLSFNSNKIITSCGGGMILTQDHKLAEKARYLISQAKDNKIYYIHNEVGYNFALSNIHSAVGYAQVKLLRKRLFKKKKIHNLYKKEISKIKGLKLLESPTYSKNNHWLNVLEVDGSKYKLNRNQLINSFLKNNIEVRAVWHANHKQKPYKNFQRFKIERSNNLIKNSLCLPSGIGLKSNEIKYILNILK